MLRRVRTEGRSVTEATKLFGESRPTFYKLLKDFDRSGLVGLLPVKRGPHGPRKITPEVHALHRGGGHQQPRLHGLLEVEPEIGRKAGAAGGRRRIAYRDIFDISNLTKMAAFAVNRTRANRSCRSPSSGIRISRSGRDRQSGRLLAGIRSIPTRAPPMMP
jgi:Winged helix-turn helix